MANWPKSINTVRKPPTEPNYYDNGLHISLYILPKIYFLNNHPGTKGTNFHYLPFVRSYFVLNNLIASGAFIK